MVPISFFQSVSISLKESAQKEILTKQFFNTSARAEQYFVFVTPSNNKISLLLINCFPDKI
jgi:hypothetical protein